MDSTMARRAVAVSFIVVLFVIGADEVRNQHQAPRPSRFAGAALAYFLLAIGAEAIPVVAGPMGVLVALGMALRVGYGAFSIGSLLSGSSAKSSTPPAPKPTPAKGAKPKSSPRAPTAPAFLRRPHLASGRTRKVVR